MSLDKKYRPQQIVKPEDMIKDHPYALTINPNDNFQYVGRNTIDRLNVFKRTMEIYLDKWLSSSAIYKMYVEVSAKGRLHMHGVVRVHDIQSFYVFAIPNILSKCSIELDTINDKIVWSKYCMKQSFIINITFANLVRPLEGAHQKGIYEFIHEEEIKEEAISDLDC